MVWVDSGLAYLPWCDWKSELMHVMGDEWLTKAAGPCSRPSCCTCHVKAYFLDVRSAPGKLLPSVHMCVCVCARACVCVHVRARVCVRACGYMLGHEYNTWKGMPGLRSMAV